MRIPYPNSTPSRERCRATPALENIYITRYTKCAKICGFVHPGSLEPLCIDCFSDLPVLDRTVNRLHKWFNVHIVVLGARYIGPECHECYRVLADFKPHTECPDCQEAFSRFVSQQRRNNVGILSLEHPIKILITGQVERELLARDFP